MNSLLIGRYSPFHAGHKKLVDALLNEGKSVVVAVRDTKLSEHNPYSLEERMAMVRRAYDSDGRVQVVAIPDIEEVCYGRDVGWSVREVRLDEATEAISATVIRRGKEQTKKAQGFAVWLTGLPCSGKSTIGDAVADELRKHREKVERLDGDRTRALFWPELGFSKGDRDRNILRVGALAELLVRNGIAVVASFISPYRSVREMVRIGLGNFVEVYVRCPVEVCEARDKKGMYRRARAGELAEFTGVSAPYEEPIAPEVIVDSDLVAPSEATAEIVARLGEEGYI